MKPRAIVASMAALAWIAPRFASAHEVGLSRGDYKAEGLSVVAEMAFARKELSGLVAGLDANHDGALTEAEVNLGLASIQGAIVNRVKVEGDGAPCTGKLMKVELAEQDGVVLHASFRCAKRPSEARVTLTLLDDLPFGHRHLARAFQAEGPLDLVISQRQPSFSWKPPLAPAEAPPTDRTSILVRGAMHVARAWTLPVFMIGILARAEARRPAILAAFAFMAASLAGLFASALFAFTPSPRAVAVAIALSLVYAGIDALADRGGSGKKSAAPAFLALPFGAVHGLGAAVTFRATAAPNATLGAFAAGMLGAVALVSCGLVPAVLYARAKHPSLRVGASVAVLVAGALALARVF